MNESTATIVGIFVGGKARRFGGIPKGMLAAPDGSGTLVERIVQVARATEKERRVVLVGAHDAYRRLGLPAIQDDPEGVGPIGGLRALLNHAVLSGANAIALACDLPYVTSDLLDRLLSCDRNVHAVAPRIGEHWQPLCAWYRAAPCLDVADRVIAGGRRALRDVLEALGERAHALALDRKELDQLDDWDRPEDLR